ncbi:MAG: hypothetical protein EOO11_17495 [Chitinophagaceae bacterium]|nr:MAG: hypothetical protein EOO11_17495 [Chitinophagaceae bacterium]
MHYDDPASRKLDAKIEAMMEQYRSMPPGLLDDTIRGITESMPVIEALASKPERTEEENELMRNFLSIVQKLKDLQLVLDYSIGQRSLAIFEHVRKKAADGDPAAVKAYEDLLPSYRRMLQDDLDGSVQ